MIIEKKAGIRDIVSPITIALISFLLMAFLAGPLFAQTGSDSLTSVTTGKRKVINNNIQQAKQKAVSDALDIAVQNAFSKLVSRQDFAATLGFFYEQVLPKASDYIVTYSVLGGIESKEHFLVAVESKVNIRLLEKKLTNARILNVRKDKPAILFFIVEKSPSDPLPKYWWGDNQIPYQSWAEKIITGKMLQDRFIVAGNDKDRPDPKRFNISFNSIDDVDAAKILGKKIKADMIVFGNASSKEATNRMGEEKTFDARIDLETYDLETGNKVVVSQIQATEKSDNDHKGNIAAIEKAAHLASSDLSEKLNAYWAQHIRKEHSFDLYLQGDNFLPRFIALKQRLRQMSGIENMQPKEIGSNSAVIEIFYKGKSSQFADVVMLKTFDAFGLEILEVTDSMVTINFIDK